MPGRRRPPWPVDRPNSNPNGDAFPLPFLEAALRHHPARRLLLRLGHLFCGLNLHRYHHGDRRYVGLTAVTPVATPNCDSTPFWRCDAKYGCWWLLPPIRRCRSSVRLRDRVGRFRHGDLYCRPRNFAPGSFRLEASGAQVTSPFSRPNLVSCKMLRSAFYGLFPDNW